VSRDYLTLALPAIARGGDSRNAIKGKTLNRDSLGKLQIPIPSLEEQALIVTTVRSFFTQMDEFKASLVAKEDARRIAILGLAHNVANSDNATSEDPEDD
jgi:restriction endonuclease S subunit